MNSIDVRTCEKFCLTVTEAAAYFGIGEKKLRKLIEENQQAKWFL